MRIAEVNGLGTAIIRYPLTFDDVKREALLIGWPENPTAATFHDSRYRIVEETAPPAAEFGETVQELTPVLVDGTWRRVWTKSRITLPQAKQQLAQMVVETYWGRLLREPPVAEFQNAGRSGVAVLQGRSTRWTSPVNDVAARIQAAPDIDAAYAIFLELEALA